MLKNIIGYCAFFFSAFLLFCYLRLPADALVQKVVHDYVNTRGDFSLEIGEVVNVGLGGASFRDLKIKFGPRRGQASPENDSEIMIESLEIDVGLFSLIGQRLEMTVEAEIFSGELESKINVPISTLQGGATLQPKGKDSEEAEGEKEATRIELRFKDLQIAKIPRPAGAFGLEIFGGISGELVADSNAGDLRRAGISEILEKGKLQLQGDAIAVKKGNLTLPGLGPMMRSGLEIPDLKIGDLVVDLEFDRG